MKTVARGHNGVGRLSVEVHIFKSSTDRILKDIGLEPPYYRTKPWLLADPDRRVVSCQNFMFKLNGSVKNMHPWTSVNRMIQTTQLNQPDGTVWVQYATAVSSARVYARWRSVTLRSKSEGLLWHSDSKRRDRSTRSYRVESVLNKSLSNGLFLGLLKEKDYHTTTTSFRALRYQRNLRLLDLTLLYKV